MSPDPIDFHPSSHQVRAVPRNQHRNGDDPLALPCGKDRDGTCETFLRTKSKVVHTRTAALQHCSVASQPAIKSAAQPPPGETLHRTTSSSSSPPSPPFIIAAGFVLLPPPCPLLPALPTTHPRPCTHGLGRERSGHGTLGNDADGETQVPPTAAVVGPRPRLASDGVDSALGRRGDPSESRACSKPDPRCCCSDDTEEDLQLRDHRRHGDLQRSRTHPGRCHRPLRSLSPRSPAARATTALGEGAPVHQLGLGLRVG